MLCLKVFFFNSRHIPYLFLIAVWGLYSLSMMNKPKCASEKSRKTITVLNSSAVERSKIVMNYVFTIGEKDVHVKGENVRTR